MKEDNYLDESNQNQDSEWMKKKDADRKVKRVIIVCVLATISLSVLINFLVVRSSIVFNGGNIEVKFGNKPNIENESIVNPNSEEDELSEYQKFEKKMRNIYAIIHGVYDGEIVDQKLFDEAYKGMVSALDDPYSHYMNEEDYELSQQSIKGSYVGIGITVGIVDEGVIVISPFKDSPAEKAGMKPGDIIAEVNGIEIGQDLEKAVSMMRGEEGGLVKIKIQREDVESFEVDIIRAEITRDTVYAEMFDGDIAYVAVEMFGETTAQEFNAKTQELVESGAKGMIIDLRQNGGGLVDTCIDMASNFIPKGKTITSTIDKNGSEYVYKSKGGNLQDIPVVVLIDEWSASASEIFSGAMRDYDRATLIGVTSFGKGIVQTFFTRKIDGFGDGTALKLTFSRYYTPNGENIHKKGIDPDIVVSFDKDKYVREDRKTDNQLQKAIEVIQEKMVESK